MSERLTPAPGRRPTHRPQGHAYEGDNVMWEIQYTRSTGTRKRVRRCRACHNARMRAYLPAYRLKRR